MLGCKGSLPQVVRRLSIVTCLNSLMERLVNKLCYKPLNFSQLERWQLRLDIGHYWPAYKNSLLCTSQGHNWYTGLSGNDNRYGCASPRSSGVNCDGLRLAFHIEILVLAMLFPRNQKKAMYSLPPPNRWPNRATKLHNGGIPQSIYQLGARWLGKATTNGLICL